MRFSFDLPFGKNHRDGGVRRDDHDAIGVELRTVVALKDTSPAERNRQGDAPQLVRDAASAPPPVLATLARPPLAVGDRVRALRDLSDGDIRRGCTGRVKEVHTDGTIKFAFGNDMEGWFPMA